MFLDFFLLLKKDGLPVSIREYLDLLEGMDKSVAGTSVEDFYFLCKTALIKHEQYLDRFDVLFGKFFKDIGSFREMDAGEIPKDWIENQLSRAFTEEELEFIESLGGLDELYERFRELMEEQKERHEGGSKWIGTGGTSPFGNSGYNPEGFRIGGKGGGRSAVKVWEKRDFKNYDSNVELNTRNLKIALKRLRIFTREGLDEELDLDTTIENTCKNAGYLDIKMIPSKKNRVKVIVLFDVGGSMDPYVELCSQLFSAARSEFKHMEYYYFHNCIYESLWVDNSMRWSDRIPTFDVLHKYNSDYRVIIVGDATMSPYEITSAGGSVEHYNDESGAAWLQRFKEKFPYTVWLNPTHERYWDGVYSLNMIKEFFDDRMYPLTIQGLTEAMKTLRGKKLRRTG
ncbi:MAG: VWA domain-containing protein [Bacteroidetes bacterium]|nr:VWA domain-containing protein [Bacteroidota bacterium]